MLKARSKKPLTRKQSVLDAVDDEGDLTPSEITFLNSLFSTAISGSEKRVSSTQIREMVPIEQWVSSEYYVGPDVDRIYEFWKEALIEVFKTPNKYNEVILDGSIGTGKTTCAELLILRKLYELSCFTNPQGLFNLMSKAALSFVYFSVSRSQADLTGFGELKTFIDESPYFQEHFPRDSSIDSILAWPNEKIIVLQGSNASHSIGMNMIGCVMDEANFYQNDGLVTQTKQQQFSKATALYNNSRQRARSRFMSFGVDHSLAVLVSSTTNQTSFTEKRKAASLQDKTVKVFTARLWDVKPRGTYSNTNFYVFSGSDLVDPFIVYTAADINQFLETVNQPLLDPNTTETIAASLERIPTTFRQLFHAIPDSFLKDFQSDLITSLQNIAGIASAPLGKLFTARNVYNRATKAGEERGFKHPFTKSEITVATSSMDTVDQFLLSKTYFPSISKKRYVHIDQSQVHDSTGISMVHVDHIEVVDGVPRPIVAVDFMLRIVPPGPPRQISITKVRDFLFHLRDHHRVSFGKVTYDWNASQESLQILEEEGFICGYQSVDRNDGAYLSLCNLLFEERLWTYRYEPFEEELFELLHDRIRRKVDHPEGGSKDVADSLAGAIFNALEEPMVALDGQDDTDVFLAINGDDDVYEPFSIETLLY